jgi:hypothetical protein
MWSKYGESLGSFSFAEGLQNFPELILTFHNGKSRFFEMYLNLGYPYIMIPDYRLTSSHYLFWHGDSNCIPFYNSPDGRVIVSQVNGQVCFLQLHFGKDAVGFEYMEQLPNLKFDPGK